MVVDTVGMLLLVMVTTASVQDRDGARPVLEAMAVMHPGVRVVWADGGYAGKLVDWVKAVTQIVLEIVKKKEGQHGFEVLPRRWVVERTLSWITRCRRLDRDYERLPEHKRGDDQVGHDRRHDPTAGPRTRPPPLAASNPSMTHIKHVLRPCTRHLPPSPSP